MKSSLALEGSFLEGPIPQSCLLSRLVHTIVTMGDPDQYFQRWGRTGSDLPTCKMKHNTVEGEQARQDLDPLTFPLPCFNPWWRAGTNINYNLTWPLPSWLQVGAISLTQEDLFCKPGVTRFKQTCEGAVPVYQECRYSA